jgi:hypothetical protein
MKLWVKIKQSLSGFLGMAVLAATPLLADERMNFAFGFPATSAVGLFHELTLCVWDTKTHQTHTFLCVYGVRFRGTILCLQAGVSMKGAACCLREVCVMIKTNVYRS